VSTKGWLVERGNDLGCGEKKTVGLADVSRGRRAHWREGKEEKKTGCKSSAVRRAVSFYL